MMPDVFGAAPESGGDSPPLEGQSPLAATPEVASTAPPVEGVLQQPPAGDAAATTPAPTHPRFQEVYGKWKGSERRVAELEAENAQLRGSTPSYSRPGFVPPVGSTPNGSSDATVRQIDAEIAQLQIEADGTQDRSDQTSLYSRIAALSAQRAIQENNHQQATEAMERGLQLDQAQYQQQAVDLLKTLPQESIPQIQQIAQQLYNQEAYWQQSPRGELDAVQAAIQYVQQGRITQMQTAERQVKQGAGLARTSPPIVETGANAAIDDLKDWAKTPVSAGRHNKLGAWLAKHVDFSEPRIK